MESYEKFAMKNALEVLRQMMEVFILNILKIKTNLTFSAAGYTKSIILNTNSTLLIETIGT